MALKDIFSSQVAKLLSNDEWLVAETEYNPQKNLGYESIFALASGAMGNRATHEEGFTSKALPANYVNGVFDRSEALQRELANTPDWNKLKMYFWCDPIGIETGEKLEEYTRVLDMKNGILAKHYITTAFDGRRTQVESVKFLSRNTPRCGMFRVYLTPLNYGGLFEFENEIDATVTNFIDFPRFRVKHLETLEIAPIEEFGEVVLSQTRDFKLPVATATAVKVLNLQGEDKLKSRKFRQYGEVACEFLDAEIEEGQTLVIEKYAAVISGKDSYDVKGDAEKILRTVMETGFDAELSKHEAIYANMWDKADLRIKGDDKLQNAVRFNIFHLMSTPNPNDNRTNVGAKLIHGEEYGGHAFWDTELFILPFFDYVFPDVAKKLVEYRYNLLNKARENAKKNGYEGAKYPWESADTGDEECPSWTVEGDGSCSRCYVADYEHHVTAAVAFGGMNYFNITQDEEFFNNKGIEIFLETARFWVSRLTYNKEEDRYEIHQVTGPDEWHEPVNNSIYTNYLARWNILKALDVLADYRVNKPDVFKRATQKIGLTDAETATWGEKANKIFVRNKTGVIEQFDGYFDLKNEVITKWDENGMPIRPEAFKGMSLRKTCILKQADIVMLMFLMQYEFDLETQKANFEYYEQRTLHRSSLSPSIHGLMGLRVGDTKRAYSYLERSAYVDITNNQGNTREGIHAASTGGTWQCITLGYCGMSVNEDGMLCFTPKLPEKWTEVDYTISRQGCKLRVNITKDDAVVIIEDGNAEVKYLVNGQERIAKHA